MKKSLVIVNILMLLALIVVFISGAFGGYRSPLSSIHKPAAALFIILFLAHFYLNRFWFKSLFVSLKSNKSENTGK
ncbi:MAG TPA: hypothetical protein PKZ02_01685 [Candidatus Paceibacterota bacterium]|nr:hypothetical protein [Candidatus Paceibacterota bacterium]